MPYPEHWLWWGSYLFVEVQLVYSKSPADCTANRNSLLSKFEHWQWYPIDIISLSHEKSDLEFSIITLFLFPFQSQTCKSRKVGDYSRGQPEGSLFNSYYTEVLRRTLLFSGLLHFTLDTYLIMLSVKQGVIKYHLLSLRYDSTWSTCIESKMTHLTFKFQIFRKLFLC